ncbi:MAG: nucleoside hydrolase, partial [Pricia sp.]|nr:nucleoside hydrolase [Pricia sp.]
NLFNHIDYHTDPPSRPLFDMVALAILKDSTWGKSKSIPAPILINNKWIERPENKRKIVIWEDFNKQDILDDFFNTLKNPIPISPND